MREMLTATMKNMLLCLKKGQFTNLRIGVAVRAADVELPEELKTEPNFVFDLQSDSYFEVKPAAFVLKLMINDVMHICEFPFSAVTLMLGRFHDKELLHVLNFSVVEAITVPSAEVPKTIVDALLQKYDIQNSTDRKVIPFPVKWRPEPTQTEAPQPA